MLTIRLARHGAKKKPVYHITVAEKSAPRDGRFIERVGFYNPVARGQSPELRVDLARLDHWLGVGAQPTERVRQLVGKWRKEAAADQEPLEAAPKGGDESAGGTAGGTAGEKAGESDDPT